MSNDEGMIKSENTRKKLVVIQNFDIVSAFVIRFSSLASLVAY